MVAGVRGWGGSRFAAVHGSDLPLFWLFLLTMEHHR